MNKTVTFGEIMNYMVKRSWIVVVSAFVFALIFGGYAKMNKSTTYTATSQIIISHEYSGVSRKDDLFKLDMDMAPTYEKLETNSTILKQVVNKYNQTYKHGKRLKIANLKNIEIKGTAGSLTYDVAASANNATRAVRIVNIFNQVLKDNLYSLVPNAGEVHILEKSTNSNVKAESTPSLKKYAVLGFVTGVVTSILLLLVKYGLIIKQRTE
ncbi:Wzz/FepE/Etk N-terminal domain-containing protein [Paucilactobacillus nenjiangensis]|jgi:capsular polysaccharide biosynthesis protein|uniref:Wzz/FepE/Etk N-terminal domain-containing protein n=1 Tax=Paucilactobacillus nenjiangensis TaxID=1296540 RepID=UPI0010F9445D|nr:Wzz/FepE/Etk N-terminal domain-containing protein [Paucilactobacillus nenjiangensis]